MKNEKSKVKHKAYSSGSSVTPLSTKTLAKNMTICEKWNLSIDLKLTSRSTTEWTNVFSLYVNQNTGKLDQRILEVSVRPDQSKLMLMLAYKIDTSQSYEYSIRKKVNEGNWINLKISQKSGVYEIMVDYKIVYNKTYVKPKLWRDVNLVTGNVNGKDNSSTIVHYRNFEIITCKTRGKIRVN